MSSRIPCRELAKGLAGPGAYAQTHTEKDKFSSSPKVSMASGQRDSKEWGSFPGPGQYAPTLCDRKTLPQWGFGSEARLHEVKRSRTPGPGSYETRGNLEGCAFSVCSRPSGSGKAADIPGPGQYKPSYDQIEETAPKSSFGASSRSELAASKSPG